MGREWTPKQLNAIYATDGSVLVSAAAGSGKTAVLVERVINLVTRSENPIDVDRLLIVTFTRAAAAEMRQRISLALNSLLENDPYNPNLLKQKQLLYTASISTIDSFCSEIVREYFHALGVSRDFRIADEGELDVLRKTALDNTFNTFYSSDSDDFIALLDAFSSKGGDVKLRETVLKIATFLSTQPFPENWLENMLSSYGENSVAESIWGKIIIEYAKSTVHHAINLTQNSLKILENDAKLQNSFAPKIEDDLVFLDKLLKKLYSNSWNDICSAAFSFSAGRLTPPKGYKDNPIKIAVANNRDEVKDAIKSVQLYFANSEEEVLSEMKELQGLVSTLFDLVRKYIKEFDAQKSKKNVLSFSDIELLTVKLLAEPLDDGYRKTSAADEISNRYDAVIVDEFQDVNDVQDLIFKCVSREENNIFVVGDVKQSIYGFRQAKPQIFIDRKNSYEKFDAVNPAYPATIILDKNFRSRKEVCDTVNFIFRNLMTKQSAQMDYTEDEMLNVGASYPESTDCDFEISLIEKSAFEDYDYAEIEARHIANKIHSMMKSGFLVKDGEVQRKATYGDFAVILRSTKNTAQTYVKTLIDCGIPAFSENKENSFEAKEIKVILNLLRVIDNPALDIPLLSVMCSPIFGFTPDELSQIRADERYSNLCAAVKKYSSKSEKARDFLAKLEQLKNYSYTCSVDDLIGKIYDTTAIGAITTAVKGGEAPMRNLDLLRIYARSFESNGYKTLSDFISYIDKLMENGTQLPAASSDSDSLNGVRVLSIHASKGLEYPVCFLADTAKQFNKTDLRSDVLIDSVAGLGIKKREGICRYNTLPRLAVEIEISQNEIAEELRVLYVALTRAKEKLIAVCSKKNSEKYLSNLYSKIVFGNIIEPYSVVRCSSISDWLLLCALVHPSLNDLRMKINPSAEPILHKDTSPWHYELIDKEELIFGNTVDTFDESEKIFENIQNTDTYDYAQLLKTNLSFKYKNADIMNLPQKVSASQISHNESDYFEKVLMKPSFLNKETAAAVDRGTAHHKFLQYCDFLNAKASLDSEIERLNKLGLLTEEQTDLIDKAKIKNLLNSELVQRIINSPLVFREEQFSAKLNPSLVFDEYENVDTDAEIIVQGAVDVAFEENGKLVIVDYKTDRVKDISKLAILYKKQLELYRLAMEQSTEMTVSECIICSVHLGEYIKI
ncbi:helicase-exonuclease AddAB subunit AddA [uncultured Ruminococcus sp.]|uniref:helicase-exonuclease AddAB subunit AddA n=1 Tax=uncultured Ruminococcus sp. TaxID=165186 RepID=UPI0025F5CB87|nr:helicase-exonuclease AddAB subunit AddA [uncultured Ruminococcus sp.]